MNRAVFLDRDGVLVEDVDLLTDPAQLRILPGVPEALSRLARAGFRLLVVTNQTVVARGLATEQGVEEANAAMAQLLSDAGAPALDGAYFCPHHPNATLPAYRADCECRKPKPGLLLRAAAEHGVDTAASFMVGDRVSDILAGARAGCRTILVHSGRHDRPPIVVGSADCAAMADVRADFECADLAAAADWILGGRGA